MYALACVCVSVPVFGPCSNSNCRNMQFIWGSSAYRQLSSSLVAWNKVHSINFIYWFIRKSDDDLHAILHQALNLMNRNLWKSLNRKWCNKILRWLTLMIPPSSVAQRFALGIQTLLAYNKKGKKITQIHKRMMVNSYSKYIASSSRQA